MNMHDGLTEMSKNLGENIHSFSLDGELKRFQCPKGKYPYWGVGREWEYKGNNYIVIKYGDWRQGTVFTWKSYEMPGQTKAFIKKEKTVLEEIIEAEKAETIRKNNECINKWTPIFNSARQTANVHDYLEEKEIISNYGARIGDNGALLIPAYDEKGFLGCQLIYKSAETDKWEKRYTPGIKKKGSIHPIGEIKSAKYIYMAEGFATAATIHDLTKMPVVVCWDCGNMYAAIETLRKINPKCKIIIACDKDIKEKSKDISVIKAKFCKSKIASIIIKVPNFENIDESQTDFNDLMRVEGPEIAEKQLEFSKSDFVEIICMGEDEDHGCYYFNSQSGRLHALTPSEHNPNNLLAMANHKYWGSRFGFRKDKEGNDTLRSDMETCYEKLLELSREKGPFNFQNVRGHGTWIDGKDIIINLGDRQIVNCEFKDPPSSKYLYTTKYALPIDWDNPLTDAECQKIIDLFKLLNYKNPSDYIYICGFIALSQIFNAIDWRFQLWLTGPKGTGKTEIMKMMAKLIFDSEILQSVTEAGVRQYLRADAIPLLIDEAEPNSIHAKRRMDGLIELIRQCSSRTSGKSLRGTSGGSVKESNINSIFCLASIQTYLPTTADVSRFFVINMNTNEKEGIKNWNKVLKIFDEVQHFAPRLFARMIRNIPDMKFNLSYLRDELIDSETISDPRQADQVATALASYFALKVNGKLLDTHKEMVLDTIRELDLKNSEYLSDNKTEESENCLNAILELPIDNGKSTVNASIQNLKINSTSTIDIRALEGLGIKYLPNKNQVFIPASNIQLKRALNDTMYHGYSKFLKTHKLHVKSTNCTINGRSVRGLFLKI